MLKQLDLLRPASGRRLSRLRAAAASHIGRTPGDARPPETREYLKLVQYASARDFQSAMVVGMSRLLKTTLSAGMFDVIVGSLV